MSRDLVPVASNGELQRYQEIARGVLDAIDNGQMDEVRKFILLVRKNTHYSALILSQVLYYLDINWTRISEKAGIEDDLYSYAEAEFLLSPQTVRKYADLWRLIFANPSVPDDIKEVLKHRPINFLLRLIGIARDDPDVDTWKRIAECETMAELRSLLLELRGEQTSSKTAIVYYFDIRKKVIVANKGGKSFPVAVIAVPNSLDDEESREHMDIISTFLNRAGVIIS